MGNKTTREPLNSMQSENLTEAEQQALEELMFTNEPKKFKDEFEQFKSKYCSGIDLNAMFPVASDFKGKDAEELMSEDKRLLKEVIQQMTYGFTSSQYKLNELQQGGKSSVSLAAIFNLQNISSLSALPLPIN